MKVIVIICLLFCLNISLNAQTVKNGNIYDTLERIENTDFIVSQALIAYRDDGSGIHEGKILVALVAKRDINIMVTKIWFGCNVFDEQESAKGWGGIGFKEYVKDMLCYNLEFPIVLERENGCVSMHIKCDEDFKNHIVKGFVFEYFIGSERRYFVIDKFKTISNLKLEEYITYRNNILNFKKTYK